MPTQAFYEWTIDRPDEPGGQLTSVVCRIDKTELDRLLAAYDPNSGTSPSVADARPVLRSILDTVLAQRAQ